MITSEKVFEMKLRKYVASKGGMCIKLTTEYGYIGLPDRLCLFKNNFIFFAEIKSLNKKPTKIQLLMHEKLRAKGYKVFIVDSEETYNNVITYINNNLQ